MPSIVHKSRVTVFASTFPAKTFAFETLSVNLRFQQLSLKSYRQDILDLNGLNRLDTLSFACYKVAEFSTTSLGYVSKIFRYRFVIIVATEPPINNPLLKACSVRVV